jgi:hypothetical protein
MLQTFGYIRELLSNPENLVVIFPQGQIYSLHQREILFEKGIFKALEGLEDAYEIWFSVALPEFGNQPKPCLHGYLKKYDHGAVKGDEIEAAFQAFYQDTLDGQITRIREKYKA